MNNSEVGRPLQKKTGASLGRISGDLALHASLRDAGHGANWPPSIRLQGTKVSEAFAGLGFRVWGLG